MNEELPRGFVLKRCIYALKQYIFQRARFMLKSTWPNFRPNWWVSGRKVNFATCWQVREGHLTILVHCRVYRQTVDKTEGQSVFFSNFIKLYGMSILLSNVHALYSYEIFCNRPWTLFLYTWGVLKRSGVSYEIYKCMHIKWKN
jgi:hypothetical protein